MSVSLPLSVAVVGHTNAGKTSLMRTLLRDRKFGEVSQKPGTTRHVEGGEILCQGRPYVRLYDTPGLEDSMGLLEQLEGEKGRLGEQIAWREALQALVDNEASHTEFDQEIKVLRQLLQDQLIFYVIDAREPVLGKYRDELTIINMAAKPVIPVLNFVVEAGDSLQQWQSHLADQGIHAVIEFDTVVFNFEDERRLYQKMQALLAAWYEPLQHLIDERSALWSEQRRAAILTIANLFINVAAYRQAMTPDDFGADPRESGEGLADNSAKVMSPLGSASDDTDTGPRGVEPSENTLQSNQKSLNQRKFEEKIRRAEQVAVNRLFKIFNFHPSELELDTLDIENGRWELDLFDSDNLKEFGLNAGGGAAKGAAVGVGIDAMTGGITLGAAAALGAAAGVLWTAGRRFADEINTKVKGGHYIQASDTTLQVLWYRQLSLLEALQHRGHAAHTQMKLSNKTPALPKDWKTWVRKARANTQWSELASWFRVDSEGRTQLVSQIVDNLNQKF